MDREQFWAVIEAAQTAGGGDCKRLTDHAVAALSRLPTDEILAFDRILRGVQAEAFRWDLWGAAYLIHDGCVDGPGPPPVDPEAT